MANKYVGRRVKVNGKSGKVIYADRAGLVVEFDDGTQVMTTTDKVEFE